MIRAQLTQPQSIHPAFNVQEFQLGWRCNLAMAAVTAPHCQFPYVFGLPEWRGHCLWTKSDGIAFPMANLIVLGLPTCPQALAANAVLAEQLNLSTIGTAKCFYTVARVCWQAQTCSPHACLSITPYLACCLSVLNQPFWLAVMPGKGASLSHGVIHHWYSAAVMQFQAAVVAAIGVQSQSTINCPAANWPVHSAHAG